jgi:hypothetical protein
MSLPSLTPEEERWLGRLGVFGIAAGLSGMYMSVFAYYVLGPIVFSLLLIGALILRKVPLLGRIMMWFGAAAIALLVLPFAITVLRNVGERLYWPMVAGAAVLLATFSVLLAMFMIDYLRHRRSPGELW